MDFYCKLNVVAFSDGLHYYFVRVFGDGALVEDMPHDGMCSDSKQADEQLVAFLEKANIEREITIVDPSGVSRTVTLDDNPDYFKSRYYRIGTAELYVNL